MRRFIHAHLVKLQSSCKAVVRVLSRTELLSLDLILAASPLFCCSRVTIPTLSFEWRADVIVHKSSNVSVWSNTQLLEQTTSIGLERVDGQF